MCMDVQLSSLNMVIHPVDTCIFFTLHIVMLSQENYTTPIGCVLIGILYRKYYF